MATGRELLALLLSMSDKDLDAPLSVPGHYGEHNELGLPSRRTVSMDIGTRGKKWVLAFPAVDIGPEPD
jgi:hypothetical protein